MYSALAANKASEDRSSESSDTRLEADWGFADERTGQKQAVTKMMSPNNFIFQLQTAGAVIPESAHQFSEGRTVFANTRRSIAVIGNTSKLRILMTGPIDARN